MPGPTSAAAIDVAHYLASAISAAADELAGLYEPSQPIEVAS